MRPFRAGAAVNELWVGSVHCSYGIDIEHVLRGARVLESHGALATQLLSYRLGCC